MKHPAYLPTRSCFEIAFQKYGLPGAIRTENGAPFASVGLGGLSILAVWFIKLGIRPERIEKGHPEQNGRHERMHRTLKAEAISPPRKNIRESSKGYLTVSGPRIIMSVPMKHWGKNRRSRYTSTLPVNILPGCRDIEYPQNFKIRQVKLGGGFKWQNHELYLSGGISGGELVGMKEIGNGIWQIYFSFLSVRNTDERTLLIRSC